MSNGMSVGKKITYVLFCGVFFFALASKGPSIAWAEEGGPVAKGEELLRQEKFKEAYDILIGEAKKDDARAQFLVAIMYQYGYSVDKDTSIAEEWFKKAIDSGSPNAKHYLADLYMDNEEYTDALKLYTSAAEDGYVKSLYMVGKMYFYGIGVERDICKSHEYFQRSIDNYDWRAAYFLGRMLLARECGVSDQKTVIINLLRAVDNEDAESQFLLAYFLEYGLFVTQNYQEAVDLYKRSARNGYDEAEKRLKALQDKGYTGTPLRTSPR